MGDLHWYACVSESEERIVYGRAPEGDANNLVEEINRSLVYHDLVGLWSKVFLRTSRLLPDMVVSYCENKADKNPGDFHAYKVIKLDLRKAPENAG